MTEAESLQNLHYFYSTAPQVLGALLAITGAFVVFKLDSLKRELFSHSQKLIDLGKPLTEKKYNEQYNKLYIEAKMNNAILTKNIETEIDYFIRMSSQTLEPIYEPLKYAQIGGRIKEIKGLIYDLKIYDFNCKTKKVQFRKKELDSISKNLKESISAYYKFIDNTKSTYKINGLLLGTLILYFFFIPYVDHGIGYWITLISGIIITLTSLALIVSYLIDSIVLSTEEQEIESD